MNSRYDMKSLERDLIENLFSAVICVFKVMNGPAN